MKNQPPKIPLRFLRWFCNPRLLKYIEGDLLELFEERVSNKGYKKAKWLFFWDVVRLFRLGIIRSFGGTYKLNQYGMLKNYLKVSWRNMIRQKLYSSINIVGLSIGILCFAMLFIYIQYERSFDTFYDDADLIYRVYQEQENNEFNGSSWWSSMPSQVAMVLENEFPEVEAATSFNAPEMELEDSQKNRFVQKGLFVNASFFKVFDTEFKIGNPKTVFEDPHGMVVTASLAEKIFGNKNPLGEQINAWGTTYTITGIIEDLPNNSTLEITFVANLAANEGYVQELARAGWSNSSYQTFFKVKAGADIRAIQEKLQGLVNEHWLPQKNNPTKYFIEPLSALHLSAGINGNPGVRGNATRLKLFSIIGFLILILAIINYTNLALARTLKRSKEVGLRKVIGAVRSQLAFQFLAESFVFLAIALVLACTGLYYLLPPFGYYLDRSLGVELIFSQQIITTLILVVLLTGIFTGSYPALIASALKPINAIKGKISDKSSKNGFQKTLTVVQFAISAGMIICSLAIYQQFRYLQEKDPGYNRENVIYLVLNDQLFENFQNIKNDWLKLPEVNAVSGQETLPIEVGMMAFLTDEKGGSHDLYMLRMDDEFEDVFEMGLATGRFFSYEITTDRENGIIINESAAEDFGWTPEEAIGKKLGAFGSYQYHVIGVVNDFNIQTMHLPIAPMYIEWTENYNYLSARVDTDDVKGMIAQLDEIADTYTDYPTDFQLLDDRYMQMYDSEIKEGKIFGFFTLVALMIACLGLFGMAALAAEKRMKEIGIRKVLGASVSVILVLLMRDFLLLVIAGCAIAVPLALAYLSGWLEGYAYHVQINLWMVIVPCVGSIALAVLTVAYQSIKAASLNPVDSLRDE